MKEITAIIDRMEAFAASSDDGYAINGWADELRTLVAALPFSRAVKEPAVTFGTTTVNGPSVAAPGTPDYSTMAYYDKLAAEGLLSSPASQHDIRLMTDFQIVEILKARAAHDANNEFGRWIGRLLTAWVTDSPLADIDKILSERALPRQPRTT